MNTISVLEKTLVEKIREARQSQGISQQQVADAISVPRSAISQIESGKRSVSTLELTKLANLFNCPIDYFFETSSVHDNDVMTVLYRAAGRLISKSDASHMNVHVKRFINLFREGIALKRELGLIAPVSLPSYGNNKPQSPADAIYQGEQVAIQERRRLGIGQVPVPDMPALITKQGIWASGVELPETVSGIFMDHPSIGMAILVNSEQSYGNQRFSYAHEYAHALFDKHQHVSISSKAGSDELVERRADAFAENFLMPRDSVADVLRSMNNSLSNHPNKLIFNAATDNHILTKVGRSHLRHITCMVVANIAIHFGISYQSALFRLQNLGHVSKQDAEKLQVYGMLGIDQLIDQQMQTSGKNTPEKHQPSTSPELQIEFAILVIQAFQQEIISRGKLLELAKLIEIDSRDLLNMAEAIRANSK